MIDIEWHQSKISGNCCAIYKEIHKIKSGKDISFESNKIYFAKMLAKV